PTLSPYTTLFRSLFLDRQRLEIGPGPHPPEQIHVVEQTVVDERFDRDDRRPGVSEALGRLGDGGPDLRVDGHPAPGVEMQTDAQSARVEPSARFAFRMMARIVDGETRKSGVVPIIGS